MKFYRRPAAICNDEILEKSMSLPLVVFTKLICIANQIADFLIIRDDVDLIKESNG